MKKIYIILLLSLTSFFGKGQTCIDPIVFDNMEAFNWVGNWWIPASTTGFFTNVSVSPNVSAAIYGLGTGSSGREQDWYVLPNITGLNPTSTYKFSFRLGSYFISNPSAATRGVDGSDFVDVQLSTDGGISYVSEMRISGFSNAYWDYNTLGIASKTADGTITLFRPASGGNRTLVGDGYSVIELTIPPGITQIAVDILCRVNASGEEWWIDNILLEEIYDCTILPLKLLYFKTELIEKYNNTYLTWDVILDEHIDGFIVEKSKDGIEFDSIGFVNVINSEQSFYDFTDNNPTSNGLTYYRLKWFENGQKYYSNISVVDIKNDNDFSFFPSKNELMIQKHNNDNSIYNLMIIDNIGKQVFNKNNINSNLEKIDITDLPNGIYTISIESQSGIKTHRFVKL